MGVLARPRPSAQPPIDLSRIFLATGGKSPSNIFPDHQKSYPSVIHIGPQLRTKSDLTGKSFRWRGSGQYNMIPETLRKTDKLPVFKNELKKWAWLNIPI
jgi:hypothetical protein